ncbi:MAG TPA: FadR/GntR family transcriptional regulator [Ktedonobacterales bacterium]
MYRQIQNTRIFEQIAGQIEQQILSGELRVGNRLPTERELAERFGASRTAVREAMKTLAQKGLVDLRPGRGTIVIDNTSQAFSESIGRLMQVNHHDVSGDLVEVREIFEPGVAALAAARATEDDIAELAATVATMDLHLAAADAFIEADNRFHLLLARAAQNALVLTLIDPIVALLSNQRKQIFTVHGGPQRGQEHHKHILEAVRQHDPEAAMAAMRAHLRQVRADAAASHHQKG